MASTPTVKTSVGEGRPSGGLPLGKIKLYNRGDGWFDDALLPLTLELSENGTDFVVVDRRTTSFGQWPRGFTWRVESRHATFSSGPPREASSP